MKKKVILLGKFSDKFEYFKFPPTLYSGNLRQDIENDRIFSQALEECRQLNLQFFQEVKELIKNYNFTSL